MYINSGYHNHSLIDFKDKSRPLIVGSCGTYRLSSHPKLPTYRPKGRLDFQIIYIAAGRAHFHFDNADDDTVVTAGNIVLYRPKEFQKYEYYGIDKTEVYWVHFTGSDVKNILRNYGFSNDQRIFRVRFYYKFEYIEQFAGVSTGEAQHCCRFFEFDLPLFQYRIGSDGALQKLQ